MSERTIREWLSRIDKDTKAARDRKIFDLWLSCRTQEEIAEAVGVSQGEVAKSIPNGKFAVWNKTPEQEAAANHATDFELPLYNVWKQQEKTPGSGHFGNSEVRWLDNLLYLYTAPFDIVVDPFAGGGSTIDICKKRFRRYWTSDRKPVVERAHEIREHDMTTGLPPLPHWHDVKLVYLDPPYWKQAEGQYSKDATDLANMPLDAFTKALAGVINGFGKKLKSGAVMALPSAPPSDARLQSLAAVAFLTIASTARRSFGAMCSRYETMLSSTTRHSERSSCSAMALRRALVVGRMVNNWRG